MDEKFRTSLRNQRLVLEGLPEIFANKTTPDLAINRMLQEPANNITDLKFHQKPAEKELRRAVKGWENLAAELGEFQSGISSYHQSPIRGLVWN